MVGARRDPPMSAYRRGVQFVRARYLRADPLTHWFNPMATRSAAHRSFVRKAPVHLWIVGGLSLLWNAFGAFDYLMTQLQVEAYMSQFTEEQLASMPSARVLVTAYRTPIPRTATSPSRRPSC